MVVCCCVLSLNKNIHWDTNLYVSWSLFGCVRYLFKFFLGKNTTLVVYPAYKFLATTTKIGYLIMVELKMSYLSSKQNFNLAYKRIKFEL